MPEPVVPATPDLQRIESAIADGQKKHTEKLAEIDVRLERIEKSRATVSVPGVDPKKFSLSRAVWAIANHDWTRAGYEKEVFDETRKRALATGTDSAGGYLVPEELLPQYFIEKLYANTVVKELGATVLDGLKGGPIRLTGQTGSATASWVGENTAVAKTDQSFVARQMQPRKLMAVTAISNELLAMGVPAADQIVQNDLAKQLGLALDLAAYNGSGVGSTPRGILNDPDVDTTTVAIGTNGGDFKFLHASQLIGVLEDADANTGRLGFAMHPKVKRKLKRERIPQFSGDTDGAYLVLPIMSDATLAQMVGSDIKGSTQIPVNLTKGSSTDCSPVIYGNWSDLFIGVWQGLELFASEHASSSNGDSAFMQDQTWIRARMICDVLVRRPASFAACVDARVNAA